MAFPIRPHELFLYRERGGWEVLLSCHSPPLPFLFVPLGFHATLGVSAIHIDGVDHPTPHQCNHSHCNYFSFQLGTDECPIEEQGYINTPYP